MMAESRRPARYARGMADRPPDRTSALETDVAYMQRTRQWYEAQGYERPYVWAHFQDVPFAPLARPLCEATIALVTTAMPPRPEGDPRQPKRVYSMPATPAPDALYTDDLSWDKEATHTEDVESFLPLGALASLASGDAPRIGAPAARFHGVPTEYSQRQTIEQDAPAILAHLREDGADAALLVPL